MSEAQGAFRHGPSVAVAPSDVENELREIWRASAAAGHGAVARACLLTLIGYASEAAAAKTVEEALDAAASRIPSRILLLVADSVAPEELTAAINTNFHELAQGERQIYSEEVHLKAGGAATSRLPSLVRTLRVPDVPAVFYCPGPLPAPDDSILSVLGAVERLVVDSWDFTDLADLGRLQTLAAGRLAVTDLNWHRLLPWRTQLAHLFDSQATLSAVQQLDRVTLTRGKEHPGGTYLFAGWLASRLGWHTPVRWEADEDHLAYRLLRPDGRPVIVVFKQMEASDRGLTRVHLEAAHCEPPASFLVQRNEAGFELRCTGMPNRQRQARHSREARLLVEALRSAEDDRILTDALSAALELLNAPALQGRS